MPVVIFGLVLMSAIAVAALMTAGDEMTSAQAMRDGSTAFYAAEAGLNEVYARWAEIDSSISLLEPGESKTLDWRDVSSGGKYQATVVRWDTGGSAQPYIGVLCDRDRTPHRPAVDPEAHLATVCLGDVDVTIAFVEGVVGLVARTTVRPADHALVIVV